MPQETQPVTLESSDPVIQAYVDIARDLASEANHYFDQRHSAAYTFGKLAGDITKAQSRFVEAVDNFDLYKKAAEVLMPPVAVFYRSEAVETANSIESFAAPEVWGAMNAEQKVEAAAVRSAIAEGPLKEQGVTAASLRVVRTELDGKSHFTLVHTGAGIDIGNHRKDYDKKRSYNSVMSDQNDALFQVEFDGVTYDTRSGMTDEVYVAKVEDACARGITLPDSKQLADETNDVWTWTMLTGEELTAVGDVQARRVREGRVDRGFDDPDTDDRPLRVCPAVAIK
jgi:hypothetical protein